MTGLEKMKLPKWEGALECVWIQWVFHSTKIMASVKSFLIQKWLLGIPALVKYRSRWMALGEQCNFVFCIRRYFLGLVYEISFMVINWLTSLKSSAVCWKEESYLWHHRFALNGSVSSARISEFLEEASFARFAKDPAFNALKNLLNI